VCAAASKETIMTIPLTGAGGLFTRLGHLYGRLADMDALRGGAATANVLAAANLITNLHAIAADFFAGTPMPQVIDGLTPNFNSFQNVFGTFYNQLAGPNGFAANTIIQMAALDAATSGQLPDRSLRTALTYLVQQMSSTGAHLAPSTVALGAATAVATPHGSGVIVGSLIRGDGHVLQTPFAEQLTFSCTQDSQTGAAPINQETFSVVGAAAVADPTSYLWGGSSGGSGVRTVLSSVDPTASNSGNNLLVNSSFALWSNGTVGTVPDNWVALQGAAHMSRATNPLFGTHCLEITGDGSTLTALAQPFNTMSTTVLGSGGTPARLSPQLVYLVNVNYQLSVAAPATGILALELVDGTPMNILDSTGAANSIQAGLTGIADTNWHHLSGAFRLPALLPPRIQLRVGLAGPLPAGDSIFLDGLALGLGVQLYAGGPIFRIFAGPAKFLLGDTWTIAVTNSYGAFAKFLERFFGLRQLGLQFPYSGSGTAVPDALII
jgi:hypothetical protein